MMAASDGEKQLTEPQNVKFTMSDALMKSCKKVEAIQKSEPLKTERASLEVLRLAQKNLDRLEQEIAAFKKKHPGLFYPPAFCSAIIRPVEFFVFDATFHCARISLEQGSYEEALEFARMAGQFSVSHDDAWEESVATVVLDVVKKSYRGLGHMEAYAKATMDQARMIGALDLGNDNRVKILCEAAVAQIGLDHFTDAIASASEALRVSDTPPAEMYAHYQLGLSMLADSDAVRGLPHLEEAEKLAKVHGRGDFFTDAADFAKFREGVASNLRLCRKVVAHEDEVAEDAFDLAAIGCERPPLPAQP